MGRCISSCLEFLTQYEVNSAGENCDTVHFNRQANIQTLNLHFWSKITSLSAVIPTELSSTLYKQHLEIPEYLQHTVIELHVLQKGRIVIIICKTTLKAWKQSDKKTFNTFPCDSY